MAKPKPGSESSGSGKKGGLTDAEIAEKERKAKEAQRLIEGAQRRAQVRAGQVVPEDVRITASTTINGIVEPLL